MSNPADPVNVEWVRSLKQRCPYYTTQDIAALTGWDLADVPTALTDLPQAVTAGLPIYRMKEIAG